jgi:TonB-linked SusC/RagA family outer membrane protein
MKKKHICVCVVVLGCLIGSPAQAQYSNTDTIGSKQNDERNRLLSLPKRFSTAAISTVESETLYKTPTANFTNTLYGRLAGLTVTQGSGEPGNDDALLGIRGIGTYGFLGGASGYHTYKIFVDGFEVNRNYFRNLTPAEIESVSILKDAAALATYGMRGANGVIYVTTRRGQVGKPTVRFQTRAGIQQPIHITKPLNSYDFASLYNQANSNDNGRVWTPVYNASQLNNYRNGSGTDIDWHDQVLKSSTPYADADLVFSGGNEDARYLVSMNYANQQGLYDVPNTDTTSNKLFRRYNLRTNLDFKMFKIVEASVDLSGRITENKQPNYGTTQLWNDLARYPSNIYPLRDPSSGEWSGSTIYPNNPYATVHELGWVANNTRILQGNFRLKEKLDDILPGLYLSQAFSFNSYMLTNYSKTSNYARFLDGVKTTTDQNTPIRANPQTPAGQEDWKQLQATVGYDKSSGDHSLRTAINFHQSAFRGDGLYSFAYHYRNISGRGNYVYKDKYIGEISFSYFGSDAFAEGNRWGFYPAISAGWIIYEDSNLKESRRVNYLKLRASAGKTGSADSDGAGIGSQNGRFLYQQYYQQNWNLLYLGNGTPASQAALQPLYIANSNVFAEKSLKYNIGVDMEVFKKLSLSFDAFLDKRSDILTRDNLLPGYFGNVVVVSNLGKQTNKGFELNAEYSDRIGGLKYSLFGMLYYNKNKIDYMAEIPPANSFSALTGKSYGTRIGLVADGFYDLNDFNPDGSLVASLPTPSFGTVQPGDLKYRDLDGNGVVDQKDVTEIGNPAFPRMSYSFGGRAYYAGFDLEVLFQGVADVSVYLLDNMNVYRPFVNNGNAYSNALESWAYYPDQGINTRATAKYPRLTTQGNINNYQMSSFWLKSGDFLRIRNLTLGYSLPPSVLGKIRANNLRVFVNAVNPVTWSVLKKDYDMDPETIGGYPAMKSYNAGFSLTF